MRVKLDKRRCIGSGNCVLAAEEIFTLSDDGVVELLCEPAEALRQKAEEAARACPTAVISIVDDEDGRA